MPTYKCFTCIEGFWSRPELHAHISRQHPATSDEVQCKWCTYTCHWKDRVHWLVIHMRQHHPGHQDQYCKWRRVSSSGTTFAHQRPEVVADRSRQRRHYAPISVREELDQAYIEWLDLPQQHPTLGVEDWDAILEDGPVTPPSPHVVCEEPPTSRAEAMTSSPASTVGYSHSTTPQPCVPLTSPVSSWGQSPQCELLSEEEGVGVSRDGAFSPAHRVRGASYLASSRLSGAGSTGVGSTLTTPGSWTRFGLPRCPGTRSPGGGVGHYGPSPKSFSTACPEEAAVGPDQEGPHEAPQRAWCAHAPFRAPTAQPCAEVPSCPPGGVAIPKHHSSTHGQVRAAPLTGVVHPPGHQSAPQVPAPEIPTPVPRSVDLCGNCCVSGWIAIWLVWGMDWILYELQTFLSL